MYEYHFERVKTKWNGMKDPLYGMSIETQEYREIITVMAKEGWRYVGMIPAVQRDVGFIDEMDLVFEKAL